MIHRRSFLAGIATSLIAAPAIVRAASIMPVRAITVDDALYGIGPMMYAIDDLIAYNERLWQCVGTTTLPTGRLVQITHKHGQCVNGQITCSLSTPEHTHRLSY